MRTSRFPKTPWRFVLSVALLVLCFLSAQAQGVTIYSQKDASKTLIGDAQFDLVSSEGVHVLIDVADPTALTRQPTDRDILLTTHAHYDHYEYKFASEFKGRQLKMELGEIKVSGVNVKSVAASHSDYMPTEEGMATNYIYVIDIGGLRIAHLGDTQQETLTDFQKKELVSIDVLLWEYWDEPKNRFYDITDALAPRLIIPTHLGTLAALQKAIEKWPTYKRVQKDVFLTKENLPERTTFLLLGDWVKVYGSSVEIPDWERK